MKSIQEVYQTIINEAKTVTASIADIDIPNVTDTAFKKDLKKYKVKLDVIETDSNGKPSLIELTGKKEDLLIVIMDQCYVDRADAESFIDESVKNIINEAKMLAVVLSEDTTSNTTTVEGVYSSTSKAKTAIKAIEAEFGKSSDVEFSIKEVELDK